MERRNSAAAVPPAPSVTVAVKRGEVTEGALTLLSSPLVIDGYKIQPVKVEIIKKEPSQTILKMTLFEGRNRQIRKMCALADLKITRLTRVALGNIALGSLEVGKWRFLTQSETDYLLRESK